LAVGNAIVHNACVSELGGNATVVFYRPSWRWRDFIRSHRIVVDGEERATIRRGGQVAVTLSPGRHTAQVRIAWTGSPSVVFHVRAEETIRLRIEPAGGGFEALDHVGGTTSWLRLSIDEAAD
jgi:hypothetical protein